MVHSSKQKRSVGAVRQPQVADSGSSLLDRTNTKDEKRYIETNVKAIVSGNHIELYILENPVAKNFKKETSSTASGSYDLENIEERIKENRKRSAVRAKNNLKRKINTNFNVKSTRFITLTFANNDKLDLKDIATTNNIFKKFIQRLRYKYGKFAYAAVIEFQDKKRRGVIHYHLLYNYGYIPHETLEEIWGHGHVFIQKVNSVENLGAYMTKYMLKNILDKRLYGQKSYFTSKGLKQPQVFYSPSNTNLILELCRNYKAKYSKEYDSERNGKIYYLDYTISDEYKRRKS